MQHALPERVVGKWLSVLGIEVSPQLLSEQLKTHPNYPSLRCITDTLDSLDIENGAFEIEKDQLAGIDTPFLAHLQSNNGEFVVVRKLDTVNRDYPDFLNKWSGVIVVAEKKEKWISTEHEARLQEERKVVVKRNLAIAAVLFLAGLAAVFAPGWIIPALLFVSLAGIFVSSIIAAKELGLDNGLADKFCGNSEDCQTVIESKDVKLPFGLRWSGLGVIWFNSLLIILLVGSFSVNNEGLMFLLSCLSMASIPFSIFSVYYQGRVAKKWCRLCLVTVGLLCVQSGILFSSFLDFSFQLVTIVDIILVSGVLLAITFGWTSLRGLLEKNKEWKTLSQEGTRFRRNEQILKALSKKQRKIDNRPWKHDLQIGNARAAFQVMIACNPYCAPCARAHEKIHNILEQQGHRMGLTIRFNISTSRPEDKRTRAAQFIIGHIESFTKGMSDEDKAGYARKVLHDWFSTMDEEEFLADHAWDEKTDVSPILKAHEEWSVQSRIIFTPAIFINGRELPPQYKVTDLTWLINADMDHLQQEEKVNELERSNINSLAETQPV